MMPHQMLKLADRMKYHVEIRGGPLLAYQNSSWNMMLQASSVIKLLVARQRKQKPGKRIR
jgi:hypothetical protein